MKLDIDPRSPTWRAVAAYAQQRLDDLRIANDRSAPIEVTEHNRGQIKALKDLLALPERVNPAQTAGDQQ